jgi:hypothetical protein
MDASVLYPQIGIKEDTASSTGSLHAKTAEILNDLATILLAKKGELVMASNTLRASADVEDSSPSDTRHKVKSIQVFVRGYIRVSFDIMSPPANGYGASGYIYLNGVHIGLGGGVGDDGVWTTLTHDILVDEFDTVELWVRASTAAGDCTAYWKNFRIYYDVNTVFTKVLLDT